MSAAACGNGGAAGLGIGASGAAALRDQATADPTALGSAMPQHGATSTVLSPLPAVNLVAKLGEGPGGPARAAVRR
jgi:hypothetical protein